MTEETIKINDAQQSALEDKMQRENRRIAANNLNVESRKAMAEADGVEYTGPEPETLLTFNDVVQRRFDESMEQDVRAEVNRVAQEVAQIYVTDPTKRAELDQWRRQQPVRAQPERPARPTTRPR